MCELRNKNWFFIGITGQGQQSNSTQSCNPLGLGLNLNALPVNPALVAAALNQAGWGLIGSLQNQPEPNFNQGFNNPPNSSNGKWTFFFRLQKVYNNNNNNK